MPTHAEAASICGRPYLLRHGPDGRCAHLGPTGCDAYAHRPATCRRYDCRDDPRVWTDYARRELASAATIDGVTDSDFGLGGTNMKGYTLGLSYAVDQNAWLNLRWLSAESIDSFSLVPSQRYAVDVLQADINARF